MPKKMGAILVTIFGFLYFGVERSEPVDGTMFRPTDWKSLKGEYLGSEGVIYQTKKNNCGVAAVKMVLEMNGVPASFTEVESELPLTAEGATMLTLQTVLRQYGLESEGWRIDVEELPNRRFPMILFVHGDHFVVADSVDGQTREEVFLRDPSSGRWRVPRSTLRKIWKGETLIFSGE